MPAKRLITEDKILEAALQTVRERGFEALNMRELAKKCSCSTQPLYLCFGSAEKLKYAVAEKITQAFNEFIENQIKSGEFPEYKAIGMGYIRFAAEEKEFFKYLFMRNRTEEADFEKDSFDKSTFIIMKNLGLYKDDAYLLHAEMWIFVHGIAAMIATGYQKWDGEVISRMLTDAYKGFISQIKNGGNK